MHLAMPRRHWSSRTVAHATTLSTARSALPSSRSWGAAAFSSPSSFSLRSSLHTSTTPLRSDAGTFSLPLPHLGTGVVSARVSQWFVAPGDAVQRGQPLCAIQTPVGQADLAAPDAGVVTRLMCGTGETVLVGHDLLTMRSAATADSAAQPMSMALEQATHIVRLERAYAAATDDAQRLDTLVTLLRACNDAGFHARVLHTVEMGVSQTMAHDTLVAEQYWRAKDALEPNSPEAQMQAQQEAAAAASAPAAGFAPSLPAPSVARPPDAPMDDNVLFVRHAHMHPFDDPQGVFSARRMFAREDAGRQQIFVVLICIAIATGASVHLMGKTDKSEIEKKLRELDPSLPKQFAPVSVPKTRLSDVCGCDEAKHEVAELVEFLKNPEKFNRLGGKMPRGMLLLGPPGTGKTLLARAIAGEAGVPFFSVTGSEFEEKYTGVGAKRIRELFGQARKLKRAIIFIDEIDTVGGKRSVTENLDDSSGAGRASLNQLLTEMDGFVETSGVIVIAATNYAETLDPALLRPGRFDRHVSVPVPDIKGRREILNLYAKKLKLGPGVDLGLIARGTAGMTGADLFHLLNSAALRASALNRPAVTTQDVEYIKDKIMMGAERTSAVNSEEMRRHLAYYQAGRSLISLHTSASAPLHKVTIVQRGTSLGTVSHQYDTDEDRTSQSYEEMLARLDQLMGGRAAEEVVYGAEEVTSHASADLAAATDLARAMVMQLGFGEQHGPVADSSQRRFSEAASHESKLSVDREVRRLLDASHARAKGLLHQHADELHRVADALVQFETLDAKQVRQVARGEKIQINNQNQA